MTLISRAMAYGKAWTDHELESRGTTATSEFERLKKAGKNSAEAVEAALKTPDKSQAGEQIKKIPGLFKPPAKKLVIDIDNPPMTQDMFVQALTHNDENTPDADLESMRARLEAFKAMERKFPEAANEYRANPHGFLERYCATMNAVQDVCEEPTELCSSLEIHSSPEEA